jgi:hypothetical protein
MATDLSHDAHDKLRAVLNHSAPDPDDDLGTAYRDACGAWFAALTGTHKSVTERILEVYADGNEAKAEWLASALPPAPRFPVADE